MPDLPNLSLDDAAQIERSRNEVLSKREAKYPLAFADALKKWASLMSGHDAELLRPMPAALKVELRDYACALLDSEAEVYIRLTGTISEVRSWIDITAARILAEVTNETKNRTSQHDFHCPIKERVLVVADGLKDRSEYWWRMAESSPAAVIARSQATSAGLEKTMALANDVISKLTAPSDTVPAFERPRQAEHVLKVHAFPNRANWLRQRLQERKWSPNKPSQFGGPDHKTIKRILNCLPVQDGSIDKLLTCLNKVGAFPKLAPKDIPSD